MNFKFLQKKIPSYLLIGAVVVLLLMLFEPTRSFAQDATGAKTGTINDVPAATAGKPTVSEVGEVAGHNKIAINIMWTLLAGFLVMFMQAGFALVETGFTQKKNVAHTMGMNFMVYAVGMFGFWICGFAFMFGGALNAATLGGAPGVISHEYVVHMFGHDFGLAGSVGFFLNSDVYDVGVFTLFLFQMVFMDTTATIPTGSMAERWSFKSFLIFGFFISMFVYPIYGNWVWGGGWLSQLGANFGLGHGMVDFAGSSVVHMVGGVAALAGAIIIGPRIGKFNADGTTNTIPGHNIPMALLGTFILALGWFGFNPGSTLAGGDFRISIVAVNTMMAGTAGTLAVLILLYIQKKKPDPGMLANGMLAGLVAITAPCAFVNSLSSVIIGAIAGALVVLTIYIMDYKVKIDDPVGAFAVHGVNGAWGVLAVGLFSDGSYGDGWNGVAGPVKGLFYGDASQLGAQSVGALTCLVFVFVVMYAFFKISNKITPIRVKAEDEIAGLDIPEMGVQGYVD
ncbi:ammonium transporter [Mucilaginibacter gilvus]|uniref:Ammonium transporter n=1 Tax=Mucilaginibacter gilvus TaxID=2305909 RepID=A0A3S4YEX6_9SPHI|nr:ammonium transporter [Mucilaginibacter gilvus]RWY53696.1 ammonium transporter [Mucilaginibacter gilvus]